MASIPFSKVGIKRKGKPDGEKENEDADLSLFFCCELLESIVTYE